MAYEPMRSPQPEPREFSTNGEEPQPDIPGQSINIGHLEVYNFSPPLVNAPWSVSGRRMHTCWSDRSTSSSGPICRICHEGENGESLLAPCNCMGTIALVHVSCMERWLRSTETDNCELCHYKFKTSKLPRPFTDFVCHWIRSSSSPTQRRSIIGDTICLSLLTPIAIASVCLCLDGALQQFFDGSQMEAGCLLGLCFILATIYVVWISVTVRYYYRNYRDWQQNNQEVHILPRRAGSPPSTETNVPRTVPNPSARASPRPQSTLSSPEVSVFGPSPVPRTQNV